VGIFRVESDLDDALTRLADLNARWPSVTAPGTRVYNPGMDLVFELRNMLVVSEAVTRAARLRTESRGAHSRLDHPATEPEWETLNVVVGPGDDGMSVRTVPTVPIPDELRSLLVMVGSKESAA
jgi:succinate dehydrogenase / fumarate reductase flavoprotein subunit